MRSAAAAFLAIALAALPGCGLFPRSHQATVHIYAPAGGPAAAPDATAAVVKALGGDAVGAGLDAANALGSARVVRIVLPTRPGSTPCVVIAIDIDGRVTATIADGTAIVDATKINTVQSHADVAQGAEGPSGVSGAMGSKGDNRRDRMVTLVLKWITPIQAALGQDRFREFLGGIVRLVNTDEPGGFAVTFAFTWLPELRDALGAETYALLCLDVRNATAPPEQD